ncbi:Uncharacterised protein [Actinomyces bovis]|uniref:Uncharacterized protein n=1 Tax=Actinomyces bovis TaxID=1658 RepID=A0ABY1VP63_9ACTO|nr:hypothetical protein [Actinomyces bovis]SPT53477.1 Uncharacterised protein [Actinomyces bovis]VEG55355.1 Uncharacterised protein [Actinomyces israelii]
MIDPLEALLSSDNARAAAARNLGAAHKEMIDAIAAYRACWRTATGCGWSKTDLVRAGFTDPTRLPRKSTTQPAKTNTEE